MVIPAEYNGREQTFLKHQLLKQYLQSWAQKLGSIATNKIVKLWYVDCFSGPWETKDKSLNDSSILIGLNALQEVTKRNSNIKIGAIFIEKDNRAYKQLSQFIKTYSLKFSNIDIKTYNGEFGTYASEIDLIVSSDPGFIFVDPTGWTGADMKYISQITKDRRMRDVLINVMYEHISRFKDTGTYHDYIPKQMRDFFGLTDTDLPRGLSEESLMSLYRNRLSKVCNLKYAADVIVPHPKVDKTKFRLVIGGNHTMVIELFRKVEKKVMGDIAKKVKINMEKIQNSETGQIAMFAQEELPLPDVKYDNIFRDDLEKAKTLLISHMAKKIRCQYKNLWICILQECHIQKKDLNDLIFKEHKSKGFLRIEDIGARERTPKDHHFIVYKT